VPVTYNLRFPGQLYDAHAGLHQSWNRDYDPAIGRYVESDPIGLKAEPIPTPTSHTIRLAIMAEPERDGGSIDALSKQVNGYGVTLISVEI